MPSKIGYIKQFLIQKKRIITKIKLYPSLSTFYYTFESTYKRLFILNSFNDLLAILDIERPTNQD